METLGRWLELLVVTLTFGAYVAGAALIVLGALNRGWGAPLPRRRFLPLLWALGFSATGWVSIPTAYLALSVALAFLIADFPIRWLLIPLGGVRATYVFSRLAGNAGFPPDPRLRPLFFAARALERRPSQAGQRFLERRLLKCGELGPLGAAAAALVARSRGDVARAQGILRGVACVTDGEQNALLRPVLRDLSARDEPPPALSGDQPPAPIEASLGALVALARRLPRRARAVDVAAAVASLDELAGASGWALQLERRGAQLCGAAQAGVAARAQVLAQATSDLAEAALAERWPAAWLGSSSTADAVRVLLREQRLAIAERLAEELLRRSKERRVLPEAEEWQAFGELVRVSQEIEQDAVMLADRQLHFRAVHRPLWNYGYYQAFELGRRNLGGVVFLRQRRLAYAAEAAESYSVIEGNLRATRAQASPAKREASAIWHCDPRLVRLWRRFNVALLRLWLGGNGLAVFAGFAHWGFGRGTLLAALLLTVHQLRSLREPVLVEVLRDGGSVCLQTSTLRWPVAPGDLELTPSVWLFSRVRLNKLPWWLPSVLFTLHGSREAAERERRAVQEASGVAGSRARG